MKQARAQTLRFTPAVREARGKAKCRRTRETWTVGKIEHNGSRGSSSRSSPGHSCVKVIVDYPLVHGFRLDDDTGVPRYLLTVFDEILSARRTKVVVGATFLLLVGIVVGLVL